jgi:hypothetical protein
MVHESAAITQVAAFGVRDDVVDARIAVDDLE